MEGYDSSSSSVISKQSYKSRKNYFARKRKQQRKKRPSIVTVAELVLKHRTVSTSLMSITIAICYLPVSF